MKVNWLAGNPAQQNPLMLFLAWCRGRRGVITDIIGSLLVLLFSYTAISKLLAYETFVRQLGKSPYVEQYASVIAWLLPVTECLIALLLLIKATRLIAFYAAFALMLLFTVYIYAMLHYSYYIPCSCGGVLAKMSWTQHFWFNIAFTLLALLGIILTITNKSSR